MRTYMGVCPYCDGENFTYGAIELEGDQCYFPRTCEDCGAKGEEWYNMDFIGHENVRDCLLEKTYEKFGMTGKEILEYAKTRDDLGIYDGVNLLNWVEQYHHVGTIEDCLDEFSHLDS